MVLRSIQFIVVLVAAVVLGGCGKPSREPEQTAGKPFELDVQRRRSSLLDRAKEEDKNSDAGTAATSELSIAEGYATARNGGVLGFGATGGSLLGSQPGGVGGSSIDVRLLDVETVDKRYKEHFDRAEALLTKGQLDEALLAFDEAKSIDPRNYAAYVGQTFCYFHKKDFGAALAAINFAIGAKPDMLVLYGHRGQIRAQMGDLGGAIDDYSRIIKANPKDPLALAVRAQFEMQAGNLQGAITDYTAALRERPSEIVWQLNRGWAYFRLRRFTEAASDATVAIRQQPKLVDGYFLRAVAKLQAGDTAAGRPDFDEAVRLGLDEKTASQVRGAFYPPTTGSAPQ